MLKFNLKRVDLASSETSEGEGVDLASTIGHFSVCGDGLNSAYVGQFRKCLKKRPKGRISDITNIISEKTCYQVLSLSKQCPA